MWQNLTSIPLYSVLEFNKNKPSGLCIISSQHSENSVRDTPNQNDFTKLPVVNSNKQENDTHKNDI